jgi:transposase-like protein
MYNPKEYNEQLGYIYDCPRCGKPVEQNGLSTAGQQWTCNNCGESNWNRTYVTDNYTEEEKTKILEQSIKEYLKSMTKEKAKEFLSKLSMYDNDGQLLEKYK